MTRSRMKNADTFRNISSVQVSGDKGSGPVRLKEHSLSYLG